ncbi:glycosyltransferase, group 2 family protein [Enterococcus hermanniensis]|uniref:Glycosyltransferase, group 2 family protein n=1 Tax=Enterococcus hermanniensis TaxID=249189 RepID=A0A1L8TFU5_9ENTE|nr:glycosyltransferase, group 2 family protein [Enterococcus hermanniensis]
MILIWNKKNAKKIKKPEVEEQAFPAIDVFIATHNETVDLLLKTVNAATRMNYPDKKLVHIYLCDDSNRPEVAALAAKFSVGYIGLEDNQHAKSGNLNNALNHSSSPLVATFDADMIPYSNFLLETVPYYVQNAADRKEDAEIKPLGLVQTPQSFYNADLFQYNLFSESSIPNEQDFFSREVNVLNNAQGAAIYTGSNTLISRQAIVDAGGFPTATITEDFELGILINSKGYTSISTAEPMASGLTPTDISSVIRQRVRWGRGVVQSVKNLQLLTNKDLTIKQKLVFFNSYLYWWSFLRRLIYIAAPILFTVFNVMVVKANFWQLLIFWLPSYYFLHLAMQDLSSDIRTQRWGEVQETIIAPYLVVPVLLQALGIKEKKFKVTDKTLKQSRKDLFYIIPHLLMLGLAVYGLISFNYGKFGSELFYSSIITFWLLTHIFNLTFSVLFFLGRPIHRETERFDCQNDVTISFFDQTFMLKTKNISEKGMLIVSENPLYFPEKDLKVEIEKNGYQATFTGKVARVFQYHEEWFYGLTLQPNTEEDYLNYLQVIYDGFNQSLPQFRDVWITPFERFVINIEKRIFIKRLKTDQVKKAPIITMEKHIAIKNHEFIFHEFDFQHITAKTNQTLQIGENFTWKLGEIHLQLEAEKALAGNKYKLKVTNLHKVAHHPTFIEEVKQWAKEKEIENVSDNFAA